MALEVLLHGFPVPGLTAEAARTAEAQGWDGLVLADSQNLVGDVYVELALASRVTDRILLGTAVTNPVTRHPAVTASAIATIQAESEGRAVLGIARGDSSLRFVGKRPAHVAEFESYLEQVQTYLRGEAVELDGFASRIEWLTGSGQPKVPVDVAATGPDTIAAGARHAERITVSVGAEPDRVRWAIESARNASAATGAPTLSLGAYVIVATDDDVAAARDLVRANVGIFAHFSAGESSLEHLRPEDRSVVEKLVRSYDEAGHGLRTASQTALVTDGFVDRFAVVGPQGHCVERLLELAALGLDHFVAIGASRDVGHPEAAAATERFATQVLPALRAAAP